MKLTYRGRQYDEKNQNSLTSAVTAKKEMIYRGNSLEAGISPKFPWIKYIKYLLSKSNADAVFDPIAFWYDHKREFLEDCWCWDNKQLDRCWDLTLQIEETKALKARQKSGATPMSFTHLDKGDSGGRCLWVSRRLYRPVRRMYAHQDKLKYRGVTYYRTNLY